IYPPARRAFDRERAGDDVPERHFRLGGRGYVGPRLGDDPANGEERLSPSFRDQPDDHLIGPGAAGAAEPQCGAVLARYWWHDLAHRPVHGRGLSRPPAWLFPDRPLPRYRLPGEASLRPEHAGE